MDQLDTLRIFVAVADAHGFAAAARRLGLAAAGVTRSIQALEQRLGVALLQRTTRSVRLTEAGERFLGDCRRILADLDEAQALARGDYREPQGQLAVTAPSMFGRIHVLPLLLASWTAIPGSRRAPSSWTGWSTSSTKVSTSRCALHSYPIRA